MHSLVIQSPAADVCAWVVQAEAGALQGGEDGVSQSWVAGFWVIIMDLIHPTLKNSRQRVLIQTTNSSSGIVPLLKTTQ